MRIGAHATLPCGPQCRKLGDETARLVEQLLWTVTLQPLFQISVAGRLISPIGTLRRAEVPSLFPSTTRPVLHSGEQMILGTADVREFPFVRAAR